MSLYRPHTDEERKKISEGVKKSYAMMSQEKRNERNKKISKKCIAKNQLFRFVMENKDKLFKK